MRSLSAAALARFKRELTDENILIAREIGRLLPPAGQGIVLDVGAGTGDIAAAAFPKRKAVLLDILEFPLPENQLHYRLQLDFFDYNPSFHPAVDVMLMSHVMQYIDESPQRLVSKIEEIAPAAIITVLNDPNLLQTEMLEWFHRNDIPHNAEVPLRPWRREKFVMAEERHILGTVVCPDFMELALQLSRVIFDCLISEAQVTLFSEWLARRLERPVFAIPQTVSLLVSKENDRV